MPPSQVRRLLALSLAFLLLVPAISRANPEPLTPQYELFTPSEEAPSAPQALAYPPAPAQPAPDQPIPQRIQPNEDPSGQPRRPPALSVTRSLYHPELPAYILTLSQDMLPTGQPTTITADLTLDGAPVPDATMEIGWNAEFGRYQTDADGRATIHLTTPARRAIIPIGVTTPEFGGQLGELYVVPPGHGLIRIESITDPDGRPLNHFHASAAHYTGRAAKTTNNSTTTGALGLIQPAGLNDVTITTLEPDSPYFLFEQVQLGEGERLRLSPSTAETVELRVEAMLDGAPQTGALFLQHHQASGRGFPGASQPTHLFVTPGAYTIQFLSSPWEADPMLVTQESVTVDDDTLVAFAESSQELARIHFNATDGRGEPVNPADTHSFALETPDLRISFGRDYGGLLVTPGLGYRLERYNIDSGDLNLVFHNYQSRRTVVPGSGAEITWDLGGPLRLPMGVEGCMDPGCALEFQWWVGTATGDQLTYVWSLPSDGSPIMGLFEVHDSDGSLVHEESLPFYQWASSWSIPDDAEAGAIYTARITYDLGPYQGSLTQERQISVGAGAVAPYSLTLSQELVRPGEEVAVTATLTASDGRSTEGALLEIGRGGRLGSAKVGGDGRAEIRFTAPQWRDEILIVVYDPSGRYLGALGQIYVVPDGYGVLVIDGVKNQNSQPVAEWYATLSAFFPGGGWSIHGGYRAENGFVGLVREAGLNHVEVSAPGEPGLFLYEQAIVPEGGMKRIQLSGEGTVPLSVSASIDGEARSGAVLLHHERMEGHSFPGGHRYPVEELYVTPGTYTVAFLEDASASPLLLHKEGVAVNSETTLTFDYASEELGRLQFGARDGHGDPVELQNVTTQMPGLYLWLEGDREYRTSPDLEVGIHSYELERDGWRYRVRNHPYRGPYPVEPDQVTTLDLGGPVSYRLERAWGCLKPGCTPVFHTGLRTLHGDMVDAWQNGQRVLGTLRLLDGAGNAIITLAQPGDQRYTEIPLPADATGPYTLVADFDLGPYQGPVHAEYVLVMDEPATVTLSPQVIRPGTATPVEIQVTHAGAPVAGARVELGDGYGTGTTDTAGRATITVTPTLDRSQVIPADVTGPSIAPTRANLFALDSGHAGVEVTGSDRTGLPLTGYLAAVESIGSPAWMSDRWSNGSVGLVVPAGEVYVELAREGSPFYLLGTTLALEGGIVTPVHLESQDLPETQLSATLDGEPIAHGRVALHRSGAWRPIWMQGAFLDTGGTGTAYITPGRYDAQVKQTFRQEPLLATFRGLAIEGGSLDFPLSRAEMGEIETRVTIGEESVTHGRYIDNREFHTFIESANPVVLALPEEYSTGFVQPFLTQANGDTWGYGIEGKPIPYTVSPGERVSLSWAGDIVGTQVWADPSLYTPGDRIQFRLDLLTTGGWRLANVYSRERGGHVALLGMAITDAAGAEVTSGANLPERTYEYTIPPSPSASYTIGMSRDLGILGSYATATTIRLKEQVEIRLEPEIIPVGKNVPVKIYVTKDGKPVTNQTVTVTGETSHTAKLNPKGMATVPIRATRTGQWQVEVGGETATLFALEPGTGVVDLEAVDRSGTPLGETAIASPRVYSVVRENGGRTTQAIMEAGRYPVAIRGNGAAGENYYMLQEATVPDQGRALLRADGGATKPLAVRVAGSEGADVRYLTLRHEGAEGVAGYWLPRPIGSEATVYATPGEYQALLSVFTGRTAHHLVGETDDGELRFDLADSTAEFQLSGQDGQRNPAAGAGVWLRQGNVARWIHTDDLDRAYFTPGLYEVMDAQVRLESPATGEMWRYDFEGSTAVHLVQGEAAALTVGGPLVTSIGPAATENRAGDAVELVGGAREGNGLMLWSAHVYDMTTGAYLRTVNGQVEVILDKFRETLDYYGDRAVWESPKRPGVYSLRFTWPVGPYGEIPEAAGEVRLSNPGKGPKR